jgi:predicted alpha/beta superfamily hydrolase
MHILVLLLCAVCPRLHAESTTASWAPAGVTIEPPRRMRASGFKWDHEIQIALPASYSKSNETYPVLWVTDGSEFFETAVRVVNTYERKYVPAMIVVAIGVPREASAEFQARRTYDFIPDVVRGFEGFGSEILKREIADNDRRLKAAGMPPTTEQGGAAVFLQFLVDVVRPALARDYRIGREHVLFGDSAGGFFCTYALLARPDAFQKYICGSPSLYWGNNELFRMEERYARRHRDLRAEVFFGAGENEVIEGGAISAVGIVSSMARMAEILKGRAYPSLKLHVRIFPGEEHASAALPNLGWGLRTLSGE